MKIYTIYKATNKLNHKSYIGFDSKYPNRMRQHLMNSFYSNQQQYNTIFHRSIRKYGKEMFEWEALYQSKDRNHTLKIMEPYFIKEYNSFGERGYNMTLGGEGIGYKPTEETKQKIREARAKQIITEEHKIKIGNAHRGIKRSKETCNNISNALKGKIPSIECRQAALIHNLGKKQTQESIAKRVIANTGRKRSPETIKKMKEAWVRRKYKYK